MDNHAWTICVLVAGVLVALSGCSESSNDVPMFGYANCDEAREAGATPLREGDDGYSLELDRDGDGVACED